MHATLLLVLFSFAYAGECESSYIYCNKIIAEAQNPPGAWVDGLAGCQQFFIDQGGSASDAVCEGGRCKNTCGLNNCDLNDACNAGICFNGCNDGQTDCKAGNVYTLCNLYSNLTRTFSLPTAVYSPTNITYTDFNLTFCDGFCSPVCEPYAGRILTDTCGECITGANCIGGRWCDFFGYEYVRGITNAFYPGDPVFDLSAFAKRRCEPNCEYNIGDARAGIYVNRATADTSKIINLDPIPAPFGRMPIVEANKTIYALPGVLTGAKTCNVPLTNAECADQNKDGRSYRASFATQMDFGIAFTHAAYCVNECPRFSGYESAAEDNCRLCSSLALNLCQWRFPSSGRDTCDAFARYLPGDPYNLAGFSICTETCLGAVNGSGWAPCGGGGCCDRCDIDQLNCLWRCSVGPKCDVDAFASPLSPGDRVGACVPMCDSNIPWSAGP